MDAIAANSIGAVVGGVYATGRTAAELEKVVRSLDWASLFTGRPDRRTLPVVRRVDRLGATIGVGFDWKRARLPAGLLGEHRVNRFLIEHLAPAGYAAGGDFDRLAIPFRAIAGDLATGEPVVLAKGDLAHAVRASMSIPLVFPPVDLEGRRLVDGLIVNNLPGDVARRFGATVLVAVDVVEPGDDAGEVRIGAGRRGAGERRPDAPALRGLRDRGGRLHPARARAARGHGLRQLRRADPQGLRGDAGGAARHPRDAAGARGHRPAAAARPLPPGPSSENTPIAAVRVAREPEGLRSASRSARSTSRSARRS